MWLLFTQKSDDKKVKVNMDKITSVHPLKEGGCVLSTTLTCASFEGALYVKEDFMSINDTMEEKSR